MSYTLYAHQQQVLDRALQASHGIFLEMGLGKTLVGIELAKHYKANPIRSGKTLVVCPLTLVHNAWLEDLAKFAPELKIAVLWGRTKKHREKAIAQGGSADVLIVNYESFKKVARWADSQKPDVLIFDESTKFKSPRAAISKLVLKFAPRVPRVYPMSGCPFPNSMLDAYNQIEAVAPGLLGQNYYGYRASYFNPYGQNKSGQVFDWRLMPGMLEVIMEKISPHATFIKKEDALDLPPKVFVVRKTPLSPALRQAYDEMVQHKILPLVEGVSAISVNVLAELAKLRQISSGWVYAEDEQAYTFSTEKLDLLDAVLEEIGDHQVIIWAQFRHDINKIAQHLGNQAVKAMGGMNPSDLHDNLGAFQGGEKKYLVAHPKCVGHGITLTSCSYAVYYSLSYSLEEFLQSQDRIHRIGATQKCTYIFLLAEDTIDEVIYKALTKKEVMANAALQYLRAYAPSG